MFKIEENIQRCPVQLIVMNWHYTLMHCLLYTLQSICYNKESLENAIFQALIIVAFASTQPTHSYKTQLDVFTFLNELFDVWVKSHPVAFAPQPHVG